MKCDNCGKQLTLGNTAGCAPHGLPLYVCTDCYEELSKSTVVKETSEAPSEGSNVDNTAENYLEKIKAIIPNLLSSEPDHAIFVFYQSFSQSDLGDVIKYNEYKASSLWLDITNNPTDQEIREYVEWCWKYHQKRLEMDDILSDIKHNRPNGKCIHF